MPAHCVKNPRHRGRHCSDTVCSNTARHADTSVNRHSLPRHCPDTVCPDTARDTPTLRHCLGLKEPCGQLHGHFSSHGAQQLVPNQSAGRRALTSTDLTAIPMSRFSSNDFDLRARDLKANGFTFGGSGLKIMCLWMAWWFSGAYPLYTLSAWLQPLNWPFFALWSAVVVGTTLHSQLWELMLQQNFEANETSGRGASLRWSRRRRW